MQTEFRDWLRDGAAGEMDWLQRGEEKRCDPSLVLPGARSVIVVAMNYWQGRRRGSRRGRAGRIARYAWGDDYHDVMLDEAAQARRLAGRIRRRAEVLRRYRTGARARLRRRSRHRLAWQEHHARRSTARDLVLPRRNPHHARACRPIAPQPARCGTCTRCITACPTGAITEAHRLDARRCISYLTIELKGSIPLEFRPLIGDRIYGCDTCLDVCPWNRFAAASRETAFAARPATAAMQLRDLPQSGRRAVPHALPRFADQANQTPRLPAECLCRLGKRRHGDDLPALQTAAAQDPEPLIAEHARWAICQDPAAAQDGRNQPVCSLLQRWHLLAACKSG